MIVTGSLDCKVRAFTARSLPVHMVPKGGIGGIVQEWNHELGMNETVPVYAVPEMASAAAIPEAET